MSTVSAVNVSRDLITTNSRQPDPAPRSSGSSIGAFAYHSVNVDGNGNVVVVVQAGGMCAQGSVNAARDGGIFDDGDVGTYCYLTTNSRDVNNWSVMVAKTRDGAGRGMTYTAGSGGGH